MNSPSRILQSALLGSILSFACPAHAALVYYMPFDDGTNASLTNYGTASGTATLSGGPFGAPVPVLNTGTVAPNLGSTYAADFTNANYGPANAGGAVTLPNSTTEFRLSSPTSAMTISTWVYVDNLGSSTSGIVNTEPAGENSGWMLGVTDAGKLQFSYTPTVGVGSNRETTNNVIATDQWYNVVVTWDSSSTDALRFYVSGSSAVQPVNPTGLATLNTAGEDIALGTRTHDPNTTNSGGYGALDGYMDDFAMWDTLLSEAKIASLNTAPSLLDGYNAGVMNSLFTVYDAASGSQTVGSLTWNYASGFDATGHALGDTWTSGGNNYIWLDGSIGSANGLISVVPEPQVTMLLVVAGLALTGLRRFRNVRLN